MSKLDVRESSENPSAGWWMDGAAGDGEGDDEPMSSVSLWEAEMVALTEDQLLALNEAAEDE
jgi:hypothetical protein